MGVDLSHIQIDRKPHEGEVHDVMDGAGRWEVKVHDHGLVALVDVMPRFAPAGKTADAAIVQAARVSYGQGTKQVTEDRGLIRYLMRHRHTTPLEMIEFKFHHVMPIFVARQWIRHRTACLTGDTVLSFDLPGAEKRGRRQHYSMTIERFHRLWHEGAEPIPVGKRKPAHAERVEAGRRYLIPELAALVERREETLRNMVRDGSLDGVSSNGRIYVAGAAWHKWASAQPAIRVPMRDRMSQMHLRMCQEETGQIEHTQVVDIWQNGVKPVFRVTLDNGYSIKMTANHRCLTAAGWMTLGQATGLRRREDGGVTWDGSAPAFAVNGEACHRSREWLEQRRKDGYSVEQMAGEAGVSYHTIRKSLRGFGLQFSAKERAALSGAAQRGQRRTIHRDSPSPQALENIRRARSGDKSNFWKGGITPERASIGRWTKEHAQRVHRRNGFKCVICGGKAGLEAHHVDPVWHNPARARDESNLITLCEACHGPIHYDNLELAFLEDVTACLPLSEFFTRHPVARPRDENKRLPRPTRLMRTWSRIAKIEYAGEEMTYDLEVAGPFHNFVANGFIVHNSVNEYSARYSIVRDRFYHPSPDAVRKQSLTNRQGGSEPMDALTAEEFCRYLDKAEALYADYQSLVDKGVAREMARIGLPVSIYTEWYWKIDLHNLFHFLSLRMDEHAQQEIRDYANAMFALIQPIVPIAAEAFLDYNFESMHLSRLEIEALRTGKPLASDNKRENAEWEEKKRRLGK